MYRISKDVVEFAYVYVYIYIYMYVVY